MKRAAMLLALLLALPGAARAAEAGFSVTPAGIVIHAFYNGAAMKVEGQAPEGCQVVLRFTGAPEDVRMKRKGKALGLLWMNMDNLHFTNVPKVCIIETSAPLSGMGAAGASLGLAGVSGGIGIEPDPADRAELLAELLKLKQGEGLYRLSEGGVALGASRDGMREFSATLDIPSRLSPGAYSVEVFAVKDAAVVARSARSVDVELQGVPSIMADLAFNHGAWYGVLASVVAILAGLGIGLVFQSKEPH